ncbi:5-methylcytosine restriction system specificity protein McrC [Kocuria turfanensis]|uniref:5-methylcytosine-specific restriction endonuclease system specificity protein McrC n=1 Tax=Kocuria turfanensis TaxID=388357 RepID=A0A512IH11_9MICC|nr:hypothetical protein [Kocuria turfanensis]GEO96996.1 hypothetical protein KTU01_31190 [Kocuria turfanensis]
MDESDDDSVGVVVGEGSTQIPVRNLWLLYLYASELYQHLSASERVQAESNPTALADLAARILLAEVRSRMRRGLTPGYVARHEVLTHVRDRVDQITTARGMLLERGRVACDFEELTVDTPRNRYVCAALLTAARWLGATRVLRSADPSRTSALAHDCRSVAADLQRVGVTAERPDPLTPRKQTYSHFDSDDRRMVAAAQLLLELALPSHSTGRMALRGLDWSQRSLRRLFEAAVRGFYAVHLRPEGWSVDKQQLRWPSSSSDAMDALLPVMEADVVLEHRRHRRRIVLDTKFTTAFSKQFGHRGGGLRSDHLYQLYTYVRSQEGEVADDMRTEGVLLYPATEQVPELDVTTRMHGHEFRVLTVDLAADASDIHTGLLSVVSP